MPGARPRGRRAGSGPPHRRGHCRAQQAADAQAQCQLADARSVRPRPTPRPPTPRPPVRPRP
ncbi:MAG: hypothetical protein ACLSHG_08860 [Oscillospiraceae bacterium]